MVFCYVFFLVVRSYADTGLEGSGTLSFKIIQEDGSVSQSDNFEFSFIVRSCNWNITLLHNGDTNFDYFKASFDGTNLYKILDYQKAIPIEERSAGSTIATATEDNSCIPHFIDVHEIPIIWFAYASPCCLETRQDKAHFEPLSNFGIQLRSFPFLLTGRYQQQFQDHVNASGFPDAAVWFDDGLLYDENGRTMKRWPPFDQGFTNSMFASLSYTNLNGTQVPDHFTFTTFRPKESAKSTNDIFASYEYEGWLTNISFTVPLDQSFVPALPGMTHIVDQRFVNDKISIQHIAYNSATNWLTINQVKQLPQYQTALRLAQGVVTPKGTTSNATSHRALVLILMITTTIGFLILLAKTLLRGRASG
jgi:hypothetical protein